MATTPTPLEDFLQPLKVDIPKVHRLAHSFSSTYTSLAAESQDQFLPTPVSDSVLRPTGSDKGRYVYQVDTQIAHYPSCSEKNACLCETKEDWLTNWQVSGNRLVSCPVKLVRLHLTADPVLDSGGTNLRVGFIELLGPADTSNHDEKKNATAKDGNVSRVRRLLEKSWPIGEILKKTSPDDLFGWIGKCMVEVIRDGWEAWPGELPDPVPMGLTFSFPMLYVAVS
jgi:hypothetical protein